MAYRRRNRSSMRRRAPMRRKKNPNRRRNWRRNVRNRKASLSTYRLGIFPDVLKMKLKYADIQTVSVLSNTLTYQWYCTSLYGTRSTGGHSPAYTNQLIGSTAPYRRVRVTGIKYWIESQNRAFNETWYMIVRHQDNDVGDSTAEGYIQLCMERPDAKVRVGGQQYSPSNRCIIKGYMDTAKTLGIPRQELMGETYSGTEVTRPSRYASLFYYLLHQNAATQSIDVTVRLTYYCEFYQRNQVATSNP